MKSRKNRKKGIWKKLISILAIAVMLVQMTPLQVFAAEVNEWELVGERFPGSQVNSISLQIADDGTFYIAYVDEYNLNTATVKMFNGTSWETIGGFTNSAYTSLFVYNGEPYVAYRDGDSKVTVQKYNGSSWETVGEAAFSDGSASSISLFVYNGEPYVAYCQYDSGWQALVKKYDGSTWQSVGAGFFNGSVGNVSLYISEDGTPYVAFKDNTSFPDKVRVSKYDGSSWIDISNTGFYGQYPSLCIDSDTPYLAYSDGLSSNRATVKKHNGTSWETVGDAGFSNGAAIDVSLFVYNGDPYVAYADSYESYKITVKKYNDMSWDVMGNASFSDSSAGYISLNAYDDTLYAAYRDNAYSNEAIVMSLGIQQGGSIIPDVLPTNGSFTDTDRDEGQISGTISWTAADPAAGITGYKVYWGSDTITKLAGHTDVLYTVAGASSTSQTVAANTDLPEGATHFLVYSYNAAGDSEDCLEIAITDEFTAAPQGEGTSASPYLIAGPDDLIWMSEQIENNNQFDGKYFEQVGDINMSSVSDFIPIGDYSNPFKGYYDGKDHKISNLTINVNLQYVGLFGAIASAGTVKDLELKNVSVTSTYAATSDYAMVGGIAGQNLGTIQDCHITETAGGQSLIAATNGRHIFIGGLAGSNDSMSGSIMLCSNAGDVSAGGSTGGGIYGVGGIAGYNYGMAENNLNTGSISTTDSVASLIYVGGIIGDHAGGAAEYCINLGAVTLSGGSEQKGGIVGYTTSTFSAGTITNNLYLDGLALSGIAMIGFDPGTSEGAASKTETQMKDPLTFAGWDTEKWLMSPGSYPILKGLRVDSGSVDNSSPTYKSSPGPVNNVPITLNGQTQLQGATLFTQIQNGRAVTVVTLDTQKVTEFVNSSRIGSVIGVPITGKADAAAGELNGQLVKAMENKQAVLEIRTDGASYTLPAQQINIDAVSAMLGQNISLSDIKVRIEIASPDNAIVKKVENAAKDGGLILVTPPVEFKVSCTYGSKTVEVSQFNSYVQRAVAIPDGADPEKITTAVVVDTDGSVRHIPTKIIVIDGKYYAQINSLTNSVYTIVWNPVEFTDAAKHWARDAINDMGSRMVVSGDGKGNFAPNRDITRAEFAAIVVKALGLPINDYEQSSFDDVKDTAWYSGSVNTAYEYGIISGYGNSQFKPQDEITREQAMTMISRAMDITGLKTMKGIADTNAGKELAVYSDAGKISKYAQSGVAACIQSGVVNGKSVNMIAPKENITRAEVAVIIKRLLGESNLI